MPVGGDHGRRPPAPRPRQRTRPTVDCGVVALIMLVGLLGLFTGGGVLAAVLIF
jgi:hypothetical protein